MSDEQLRLMRLIEDVFPGSRVLLEGVWRRIRPAAAEERRRWGWAG